MEQMMDRWGKKEFYYYLSQYLVDVKDYETWFKKAPVEKIREDVLSRRSESAKLHLDSAFKKYNFKMKTLVKSKNQHLKHFDKMSEKIVDSLGKHTPGRTQALKGIFTRALESGGLDELKATPVADFDINDEYGRQLEILTALFSKVKIARTTIGVLANEYEKVGLKK